jgi:hypothetical protein
LRIFFAKQSIHHRESWYSSKSKQTRRVPHPLCLRVGSLTFPGLFRTGPPTRSSPGNRIPCGCTIPECLSSGRSWRLSCSRRSLRRKSTVPFRPRMEA